jgi:hypothetical protein
MCRFFNFEIARFAPNLHVSRSPTSLARKRVRRPHWRRPDDGLIDERSQLLLQIEAAAWQQLREEYRDQLLLGIDPVAREVCAPPAELAFRSIATRASEIFDGFKSQPEAASWRHVEIADVVDGESGRRVELFEIATAIRAPEVWVIKSRIVICRRATTGLIAAPMPSELRTVVVWKVRDALRMSSAPRPYIRSTDGRIMARRGTRNGRREDRAQMRASEL